MLRRHPRKGGLLFSANRNGNRFLPSSSSSHPEGVVSLVPRMIRQQQKGRKIATEIVLPWQSPFQCSSQMRVRPHVPSLSFASSSRPLPPFLWNDAGSQSTMTTTSCPQFFNLSSYSTSLNRSPFLGANVNSHQYGSMKRFFSTSTAPKSLLSQNKTAANFISPTSKTMMSILVEKLSILTAVGMLSPAFLLRGGLIGKKEKQEGSSDDQSLFRNGRGEWQASSSAGIRLQSDDGSKKEGEGGKDPKESKKGADKKGGAGGGSDGEDPSSSILGDNEPDFLHRAIRLVLLMLISAAVLYYFARPYGQHVSWDEVMEKAEHVTHIDLYTRYAQIFLTGGDSVPNYIHVGLVHSDQHTNSYIQKLRAAAISAQALRKEGESSSTRSPGGAAPVTTDKKQPSEVSSTNSGWEERKDISPSSPNTPSSPLPPSFTVAYRGESYSEWGLHIVSFVAWTVPFLFFPIFAVVLTRGMGSLVSAAASESRMSSSSKIGKDNMFKVSFREDVKFSHIAGMHEAKREVTEIVDFLRKPEHYLKLGAKIPTGTLLLGPPGTGKTFLAKAVSGEAKRPFIAVNGSDFVELYVGMGALRVRQLFKMARQYEKCIIYIDEIDAVGLKRRGAGQGEKQEQEHTLNQLLTELDGFDSETQGKIMVLASSNVELSALDPALVRPGRFDRIVHVDAPVISERREIFGVHLKKLKLVANEEGDSKKSGGEGVTKQPENLQVKKTDGGDGDAGTVEKKEESLMIVATESEDNTAPADEEGDEDENKTKKNTPKTARERLIDQHIAEYSRCMSELCPGFVGADINNVCNEGAILAAREGAPFVQLSHLERSIDRVLAGIEMRSRVLSEFEKKVVAYHEAGHAVAGWFLGRADPLMKVSIVPRGGKALGYAQYLPSESTFRTSKDIVDSICVTLGGRVAEKIFFDHWSTGASDDLSKVTKMAYHYVASFSSDTASHFAPGTRHTRYVKPYGNKVSKRMDNAAKLLVDQAYQSTYDLLVGKKLEIEKLAQHLLKHEMLTHQDVVNFLGKRDGRPEDFRVA